MMFMLYMVYEIAMLFFCNDPICISVMQIWWFRAMVMMAVRSCLCKADPVYTIMTRITQLGHGLQTHFNPLICSAAINICLHKHSPAYVYVQNFTCVVVQCPAIRPVLCLFT